MEYIKLNLQMFATNINVTGDSGLTPEVKAFYERALVTSAEPKLVHDQFGDKYPIPKNGGKSIEFRKFSQLPKITEKLTEGVTPEGQKLTVVPITGTLGQYGGYVAHSDVIDAVAIDNVVGTTVKLVGSQAGRSLDTVTREVLAAGTQVIYAPKVAADGTETAVTNRSGLDATAKLTPDLFFKAQAQLEAQNADTIDGSYVAIIHPYAAYDVMRCEEWIDVHKYATPENIFEGELGKIGNIRFVKATEAKIIKDDTAPSGLAVFTTLVLGAHAYAVTELEGKGLETIIKPLGFADPLNQVGSIGWKGMKTAEILSNEYMIRIESCSSYSETAAAN